MTERERFICALTRQPLTGRVPHFELAFFLTMEAFGKVHPLHRNYEQWAQMSESERRLHRIEIAEIYIAIARQYEHSAIFVMPMGGGVDEDIRVIDLIRDKTGDAYFIMLHGDATFPIPSGSEMLDFTYRLSDEPEKVKQQAHEQVMAQFARADTLHRSGGLDGFALCSDYCLNTGPFLSPLHFSEFVAPYLVELVRGYRERDFYTIKHTDGNIMPILDQLLEARPDALHSLDPQAGVDIAEVKARIGDKVSLIGNVNCGLLQTGTDQEVADSVRYALSSGMPGGGYIFSTSNCIYTGMSLARYEMMLGIWRNEGQ
jgi:uroporphyrinogen decarboxylase